MLIHKDGAFRSGTLVDGDVSSKTGTIEVFDTVQELLDRALDLGLQCDTNHLIKIMEHGATLPSDIESMLLGYVWEDEYMSYWKRMEALGYQRP